MSAFYKAVAAAGALPELELEADAASLWRNLTARPNPSRAFPDLDELLERMKSTGSGASVSEPAAVRPGMWVHSDAGWGRIDEIHDAAGRSLPELDPKEAGGACLQVTLRPGYDALRVELDLEQQRISFFGVKHVYTCTKCHHFSAGQPHIVDGAHDQAAHEGVGARFRKERGWTRRLRTLFYSENRPEEPLA
jgi:hypothetical protein